MAIITIIAILFVYMVGGWFTYRFVSDRIPEEPDFSQWAGILWPMTWLCLSALWVGDGLYRFVVGPK